MKRQATVTTTISATLPDFQTDFQTRRDKPMDYNQNKAIDIIEKLNELDINWVNILIPVINNPNWKLTDYIIANYEHILEE